VAQSVAQLSCNSRSSNPNADGATLAEGQNRMAFGAIESWLALLLPMLTDTIEVVAVEPQGRGRTSTSLDRSARRACPSIRQLCSGARHRFRLVPGYSVGGAVTLQLALDRPEEADDVVAQGGRGPGSIIPVVRRMIHQ
jgi:pimeloyl-ACP methyl ester carboxylesterase